MPVPGSGVYIVGVNTYSPFDLTELAGVHDTLPTKYSMDKKDVKKAFKEKKILYYLTRYYWLAPNEWTVSRLDTQGKEASNYKEHVFYANYWLARGEMLRRNGKINEG